MIIDEDVTLATQTCVCPTCKTVIELKLTVCLPELLRHLADELISVARSQPLRNAP